MLVTRRSLVALVMLACGVLGRAPLEAQCPTTHSLQHFTDGPMSFIDAGLVPGEGVGAIFDIPAADLPAQITAVWIGTKAGDPWQLPGWTGNWDAIQVWDVVNPSPSSSPTHQFPSPHITEGQVVRNDVSMSNPPIVVHVTQPRVIVVPSSASNGPYIACDTDGTCASGRNVVRWLNSPGPTWFNVCPDVLVRIEYRSLSCTTGVPLCFGDGSGMACPCGNTGNTGRGCLSSAPTGGGLLEANGSAVVSSDSLRLDASGLPSTSSVIFLQGEQRNNGGAGVVYGDGLLCIDGALIRLGTRAAAGGSVRFGAGIAGDPPISQRGQVPPSGTTRVYQVRYRNSAGFCTPDTFNTTNAVEIAWAP